jgi:hypothetical protein
MLRFAATNQLCQLPEVAVAGSEQLPPALTNLVD